MNEQIHIDKTHMAVQGILALLKSQAGRMQIVKLVYLADNRFYEYTGRTITGCKYFWDRYGPNATNHAITEAADYLSEKGKVRRTPAVSWSGWNTFRYWVGDPLSAWSEVASYLDEGEQQILCDIVNEYGHITNATQLSVLAKQTEPFRNARQGEPLRFKQNERAIELQKAQHLERANLVSVQNGAIRINESAMMYDTVYPVTLSDATYHIIFTSDGAIEIYEVAP